MYMPLYPTSPYHKLLLLRLGGSSLPFENLLTSAPNDFSVRHPELLCKESNRENDQNHEVQNPAWSPTHLSRPVSSASLILDLVFQPLWSMKAAKPPFVPPDPTDGFSLPSGCGKPTRDPMHTSSLPSRPRRCLPRESAPGSLHLPLLSTLSPKVLAWMALSHNAGPSPKFTFLRSSLTALAKVANLHQLSIPCVLFSSYHWPLSEITMFHCRLRDGKHRDSKGHSRLVSFVSPTLIFLSALR